MYSYVFGGGAASRKRRREESNEPNETSFRLLDLPQELVESIVSEMQYGDIRNLRQTSSAFRSLLANEVFLRTVLPSDPESPFVIRFPPAYSYRVPLDNVKNMSSVNRSYISYVVNDRGNYVKFDVLIEALTEILKRAMRTDMENYYDCKLDGYAECVALGYNPGAGNFIGMQYGECDEGSYILCMEMYYDDDAGLDVMVENSGEIRDDVMEIFFEGDYPLSAEQGNLVLNQVDGFEEVDRFVREIQRKYPTTLWLI